MRDGFECKFSGIFRKITGGRSFAGEAHISNHPNALNDLRECLDPGYPGFRGNLCCHGRCGSRHPLPPRPGVNGRSLIAGVDGEFGQPQLRAVLMGPRPIQQLCQFRPHALMIGPTVDNDVID